MLCCVVSLVPCRCLLCCALGRCPSPLGPVLSSAVFCGVPPRCVLCAVCVLPLCLGVCCESPLCSPLCVCAVCVLGRRAVCSLSSLLCAVLCCAVLVRLGCAVPVVWAVSGAWCCGALLCVVLFPVVFCGAELGLVVRGCPLVAFFGVGVPVWPRCLLSCGWCCFLWCPAPLCCVLSCCAVVWCCVALLCCLFAVLFVLAFSFAVSSGAVLPCGAVLLGCAVCCHLLCVFVVPFFFKNHCCSSPPLKRKIKMFRTRKLYTAQHARRQAARPLPRRCLTWYPATSTVALSLMVSSFLS